MTRQPIKLKLFIFVLFLLAAIAGFTAFTYPWHTLTILFTHDLHSNLEEYPMPWQDKVIIAGGYARLSTAIQRERWGREKNTLVLDAGDFSMGTLLHTVRSRFSPELIAMGAMGFDATTFGNHDFEFGLDQLADALLAAKRLAKTKLPVIVASNLVVDKRIPSLKYFYSAYAKYPVLPYLIIQRAGMRIGIFGLMGKDAASFIPEATPVRFSNRFRAAYKTVLLLRREKKVDMVICLSHCGTWQDRAISEDEILARRVPGIDVIISGHTHTVLKPYIKVRNTYIVSSGAYGRYLGRLEVIKKDQRGFRVLDYRIIPVNSDMPSDQRITGLIRPLRQEVDKEYLARFGYHYGQALAQSDFSLVDFNWQEKKREKIVNSGLGDLVTDAFIYAVRKTEGADYRDISLAVEGFGQIRSSLARGNITVNDAFRVLGLGRGLDDLSGYALVTFWLTGSEIKKILEIETTLAVSKTDRHLQISGMRFTYDPKAPAFKRVQKVEVEMPDGKLQALEDERLYRVCTNWKTLAMSPVIKLISLGKISFVPKDEFGNPIRDINSTRILIDRNSGRELKEWLALAMYLESFPRLNGLPQIPAQYRYLQKRVTATE